MKRFYSISILILLTALLTACAGLAPEKHEQVKTLEADVHNTREKIARRLRDNPESTLEASLVVLDSILDYTETVKSDPRKFSDEKIQAYLHKIRIINENISRFSDLRLQTDVSFPIGTYQLEQLSAEAKQKSDELAAKILTAVKELVRKYPDQKTRIMIKTVGYTDETPFKENGPLVREIRAELDQEVPADSTARRAKYNEVLSQFRARTVSNYMLQQLRAGLPAGTPVDTKVVGRGEALPKGESAADYQPEDPRRRVCIVSPFIQIVP